MVGIWVMVVCFIELVVCIVVVVSVFSVIWFGFVIRVRFDLVLMVRFIVLCFF